MMRSIGFGSSVVKPHKVKLSKARSRRYRSEDSDSDYQEEKVEEEEEEHIEEPTRKKVAHSKRNTSLSTSSGERRATSSRVTEIVTNSLNERVAKL